MKKKNNIFVALTTIAAALVINGCLLVSGTFVVEQSFSFTTETGFYAKAIDITQEEDWQDNKDNIDAIDNVGFELWFTNNESEAVTFNGYVDYGTNLLYSSYAQVDANAFKVLDDLTLAAGPGTMTHITYGQSFSHVMNVDSLKAVVKTGNFNIYGVSSGGTSSGFVLDSGKVVVTFTAFK